MNWLKKATGLCLAAALLCSCTGPGAKSESRSIIMAAPPASTSVPLPGEPAQDAEEAPPVADAPIALSTLTNGLSGAFGSNQLGGYTLASFEDGSADILFFDYQALTITKLEQPPVEGDAYQGHVPGLWGGGSLLATQDALYCFHLGGTQELAENHGESGQSFVQRMGTDGSNPVRLVFPAGWELPLNSVILSDGAFLYFLVKDGPNQDQYILVSLDVQATQYTELHHYEPGYEYTLEGFWEMGPLVCQASPLPPAGDKDFAEAWDNRAFTLFRQGLNSGNMEEVAQWSQGESTSTQGSVFYHWHQDENTLYATDANTKEETVLAQGFAPKDYLVAQILRQARDGRLHMQFSTNRTPRNFTIDMQSGEAQEVFMDKLGDTVAVFAETPDSFLIGHSERWVNKDKVPYEFVPGLERSNSAPGFVRLPEYSLIAKGDFWAGKSNFTNFQDLVFGK